MSSAAAESCAHCEKTTRQYCTLCSEGADIDGNLLQTFYCSKECLHADRENHKGMCKQVRARCRLYRGGELLQEAFYTYREMASDIPIHDVKIAKGKLHIYERVYDAAVKAEGPLYAFPNNLVPDQRNKKALLTFLACTDALKHMFTLTAKVLKGPLHTLSTIAQC